METCNVTIQLLEWNREHRIKLLQMLIENPMHPDKELINLTLAEYRVNEAKYESKLNQ